MKFEPRDPNYRQKVTESFARQAAMRTIGCEIAAIEPGEINLAVPYDERFSQQHGFMHAGFLAMVMDSACGYAAFSLMPEGAAVLAVEFKTNLLRPAVGERFDVTGKVLKAGKTLSVCQAETYAVSDAGEKLVAQMTGTIMAVYDRDGVRN